MSDKDKNKDLLNEFLIDEDSDAVEKRTSKNSSTNNSFNNPWEENSENRENKKESSDNNSEDLNKNNNDKDEIKSAVPKSNSSQNKDRKKVSNTKPLLVIFSLAVIFVGILSYHYYNLNPVSNNSDIKQNTPPKLVTLSYRNNQETYNSILDNNDWSGDDYVFILKNYSNFTIKQAEIKIVEKPCDTIDDFKSEKGMVKKFNITLTNNQTERLVFKNLNITGYWCFAMKDIKVIKN